MWPKSNELTLPAVANLNHDSTCNVVIGLLFFADKKNNLLNGGHILQMVNKNSYHQFLNDQFRNWNTRELASLKAYIITFSSNCS